MVIITDWSIGEERLLRQLEAALQARADVAVQHRNSQATTRAYFNQGQHLKALCDRFCVPLFVSARMDVALALDAHLHLPAWVLNPADVRGHWPKGRWLSVAVHNDDEAAARASGADFALVSPVFETVSKPGTIPLGPSGFALLARALGCPAFALGGLTPERLAALPEAAGAAAISAVLHAEDPAAVVRAFCRPLENNTKG